MKEEEGEGRRWVVGGRGSVCARMWSGGDCATDSPLVALGGIEEIKEKEEKNEEEEGQGEEKEDSLRCKRGVVHVCECVRVKSKLFHLTVLSS